MAIPNLLSEVRHCLASSSRLQLAGSRRHSQVLRRSDAQLKDVLEQKTWTRLMASPAAISKGSDVDIGVKIKQVESLREDGVVKVQWYDGFQSCFLPVWLLDHDPAKIHPTSLQRQGDPLDLDLELRVPDSIVVCEKDNVVQFTWNDEGKTNSVIYAGEWLRKNSHSTGDLARRDFVSSRTQATWRSADMSKQLAPTFSASGILMDNENLVSCLQSLVRYGFALVTGMPSDMENTEKIARRFGPPRETFYGTMWETAPKSAADVNDTAYTNQPLHVHNDLCYLQDSAGLQLFNCIEQTIGSSNSSSSSEHGEEGATKLVDGFQIAEDLRLNEPETFNFFCNTPLKWSCIEKGVHARAWEPVILLNPGSTTVRQFRYNVYDLATVEYLPQNILPQYYRHTAILNKYLRSPEYVVYCKLNVGEMLIIDNHRVLHGRCGFTGSRNMIGCYIGVDDWRSTLRAKSNTPRLVSD